jgi:hypothetical protein
MNHNLPAESPDPTAVHFLPELSFQLADCRGWRLRTRDQPLPNGRADDISFARIVSVH